MTDDPVEVTLIDLFSRKVAQSTLKLKAGHARLPLTPEPGLYTIRVTSADGRVTYAKVIFR